jgi:hypothetical protein
MEVFLANRVSGQVFRKQDAAERTYISPEQESELTGRSSLHTCPATRTRSGDDVSQDYRSRDEELSASVGDVDA